MITAMPTLARFRALVLTMAVPAALAAQDVGSRCERRSYFRPL